ncbi:high mobility group B protein 7-like [Phalaenopsis equestris]|uniref:high mobility group B protein 7-like n=1 Tax=Phalaenopsis equestris TaxID=78828 RepID=UPI0009E34692|nr:high mobility group B protein 7-like [Phalaenopsis equestris]
MAGGPSALNSPKQRKRVEAETPTLMKRAKDGSAFTKCEGCKKDIHVGLIDMHDCGMDSMIKMNLEAQVVEKATEVKKPEKKRAPPSTQKERKTKKEKKSHGSNKCKRPPTAFFLFMEDFRKEFKDANPDNKKVALVAKEGGVKWKAMTVEEKKPYVDRAAELKEEYDKAGKDDENEVKEEDEIEEEEKGDSENEKEE